MSSYLGDFYIDSTLDTKFTTVNTSGVPTSLVNGMVVAYPNNSTTELTAGITLTANFDGRTGMHNVRVVASAGNGYVTGSNYQLALISGTVGGSSVIGYVVGQFSVEARSGLRPIVHGMNLNVSPDGGVISGMVTGSVLGNVNGSVGSVLGNVGGSVNSVTNPVTAGMVTGSVLGNLNGSVLGNVDGSVGSVTNPVVAGMVTGSVLGNLNGSILGNVNGSVNNVIQPVTTGFVTGSVLGNVNGSVNSVTQPVGISTGTFLDALADKVWREQLSEHFQTGNAAHTLASRMPTGTVIAFVQGIVMANVVQWASGTVAVPNVTGIPKVDLVDIDGLATNGNNAILNLRRLSIANNTGAAAVMLSNSVGDTIVVTSAADALNIQGERAAYFESYSNHGITIISDMVDGKSINAPQGILGDFVGNITGTFVGNIFGNVTGSVREVQLPVGISTGTFLDALSDKVWDEQIGGHLVTGSTGRKLNDAGAAGDPWETSLPGLYTAGQAGHIVGTFVDTHVSSRMPSGTVTAFITGSVNVSGLNPALLDVAVSSRLSSGTFANNYVTPPTAGQNATAVLNAASADPINSNVKQINDTDVTGNGSSTPWGPA